MSTAYCNQTFDHETFKIIIFAKVLFSKKIKSDIDFQSTIIYLDTFS